MVVRYTESQHAFFCSKQIPFFFPNSLQPSVSCKQNPMPCGPSVWPFLSCEEPWDLFFPSYFSYSHQQCESSLFSLLVIPAIFFCGDSGGWNLEPCSHPAFCPPCPCFQAYSMKLFCIMVWMCISMVTSCMISECIKAIFWAAVCGIVMPTAILNHKCKNVGALCLCPLMCKRLILAIYSQESVGPLSSHSANHRSSKHSFLWW